MASIIPRSQGRDALAEQLAARRPLQRRVQSAPLLAQLLQPARQPGAAPARFDQPIVDAGVATGPTLAANGPAGRPVPIQPRRAPAASTRPGPLDTPSAPAASSLARPIAELAAAPPEPVRDHVGSLPRAAADQPGAADVAERAEPPWAELADEAAPDNDEDAGPTDRQGLASEGRELDEVPQAGQEAPQPPAAPALPALALQRAPGASSPAPNGSPSASSAGAAPLHPGARAQTAAAPPSLAATLTHRSGSRSTPPPTPFRQTDRPSGQHGDASAPETGATAVSAMEDHGHGAAPDNRGKAEATSAHPTPPLAGQTIEFWDDLVVPEPVSATPAEERTAPTFGEATGAPGGAPSAPAQRHAAPTLRAADGLPEGELPAAPAGSSPAQAASVPPVGAPLDIQRRVGRQLTDAAWEQPSLQANAAPAEAAPLDAEQASAPGAPRVGDAAPVANEPPAPAAEQHAPGAPADSGISYGPVKVSANQPGGGTVPVAPPREAEPSTASTAAVAATVQRASTPPSAAPPASLPAAAKNAPAPERAAPTLEPPLPPARLARPAGTAGVGADGGRAVVHGPDGDASVSPASAEEVAPAADVLSQRTAADRRQPAVATSAAVVAAAPTAIAAVSLAPAAGAPTPKHEQAPDEPALPVDRPVIDAGEVVNESPQPSPAIAARPQSDSGADVRRGASAADEEPQPALASGAGAPRSALDLDAALLTADGETSRRSAAAADEAHSLPVEAPAALAAALALGRAAPATAAPVAAPRIEASEGAAAALERRAAGATEQQAEAAAATRPPAPVQRSYDQGTPTPNTADEPTPHAATATPATPGLVTKAPEASRPNQPLASTATPATPGPAAGPAGNVSDTSLHAPGVGASSAATVDHPDASVSAWSEAEGAAATPLAEATPERAAATAATLAASDLAELAPPAVAEAEQGAQATSSAIQRTAAAAASPTSSAAEAASEPVLETVSPRGPRPIFRRRQPEPETHADAPSPPPDPAIKERLERLANLLLGETAAATERPSAAAASARGGSFPAADALLPTRHAHPAAPSAVGVPLQRTATPAASAAVTDRTPAEADRSAMGKVVAPPPANDRPPTPASTSERAGAFALSAPLPASLPRAAGMHAAPVPIGAAGFAPSDARPLSSSGATIATFKPTTTAAPALSLGDGADDAPRWGMPPAVLARDAGIFSSAGAPESDASALRPFTPPVAAANAAPGVPAGAHSLVGHAAHSLLPSFEGWRGAAPNVLSTPPLPITSMDSANAPGATTTLLSTDAPTRAADALTRAANPTDVEAAAQSATAALPLARAVTPAALTRLLPPPAKAALLSADVPRDAQNAEPPSMATDAQPAPSATIQRAMPRIAPPSALALANAPRHGSAANDAAPAADVAHGDGGPQLPVTARNRDRWGDLPAPWEPLPAWLSAATPEPAAQASLPAETPLPVVQRAAATESAGRPASAPEAPAGSPSSAQPEADLDALARQVYGILRQRLLTEQRRGG